MKLFILTTLLIVACDPTIMNDAPDSGVEQVDADLADAEPRWDCSPLFQNCLPGEGCYMEDDAIVCAEAGPSELGEVCDDLNDCVPGSGCYSVGDESACYEYCDYALYPLARDPNNCLEHEVCVYIDGPPSQAGPIPFGICL